MVDDTAQYYDVPDVPADWNFELLGHVNLLDGMPLPDRFPFWVIPIGNLEGKNAAIYNQMDIRGVVRASYIEGPLNQTHLYDERLKEKLSGFNFRRDFLFAYANDDIVYQDNTKKVDFIRDVLSDERFKDSRMHLRASLAHDTKNRELILGEISNCARSYADDKFLKPWYESEIDMLRRPVERGGIGMPELAAELEKKGTLESLMKGSYK